MILEATEVGEEEQVPVIKVEEVNQDQELSDIENELKDAPNVDELPDPMSMQDDEEVNMMKVVEVAQ